MRIRLLAAAAAATALLATGCGGEGDGGDGDAASAGPSASAERDGPAEPDAGSESAAESPTADGKSVPETLAFTGRTVDGEEFEAASLAGKPVVLWFWAPWCTTCQAQAEETAKVAEEYEGEAHVVGVAGLDGRQAMRDFVSERGVGGFTHLADEQGDVWKQFGVTEQSHYVVLDASGEESFSGVLLEGKGLGDKLAGLTG